LKPIERLAREDCKLGRPLFGWAQCDINDFWSVIRKSGYRFSEKIMLKQKARAGSSFNQNIPL
jgi:hypothetical protein